MSNSKLLKYISGPLKHPHGTRQLVPVILADSKGRYLHSEVVTLYEREIVWLYKSGSTIKDARLLLEANLQDIIQRYGNISLYLWFGTCSLTYKIPKSKGCISLRTRTRDSIQEITDEIQKISALIQQYPGSKLTILEIPIYSISTWNKTRNHRDVTQFLEQDRELEEQIVETNRLIRYINSTLGSYSPKFSSDLAVTSKYRKGLHHNKLGRRVHHNFKLYKDGIHPNRILAVAWLKKITSQIVDDCWN